MTMTKTSADDVVLTPGEHLLVVGPTASGKTALLDRFAAEWDGEVVRVDLLAGSDLRHIAEVRTKVRTGGPPMLILVDHSQIDGIVTGLLKDARGRDVTVVYSRQIPNAGVVLRFPRVVELERRH